MKHALSILLLLSSVACMKSKEEYKNAIDDIQREEAVEENERSKGSNDAEGMGMYE